MITDSHLAKQEIFEAIVFFIDHRQLVLEAIIDIALGRHYVGDRETWYGGLPLILAWTSNASEQGSAVTSREAYLQSLEAEKVPQFGVWTDPDGDTWRFFFHGIGCDLTNERTKEPLSWDAPHVDTLDSFRFDRHLEWQLQTPDRSARLENLRDWLAEGDARSVYSLIDEMIADGMLESTETGTRPNPSFHSSD